MIPGIVASQLKLGPITRSLLHFSSEYGSLVFRDEHGGAWSKVGTGNVFVSTEQSMFGDGSLRGAVYSAIALQDSTGVGVVDFENDSYTIECFVRPATIQAGTAVIAAKRASEYVFGAFQLSLENGRLASYTSQGLSWNLISASLSPVLVAGEWTHIAFVRDKTKLRSYVNGVLLGEITVTYPSTLSAAAKESPISIAGMGDGAYYFDGFVDEFRISRGVHYTASFTPPSAPFPDVNPVPISDPYWGNVSLLLPFDGADGSTTFIDQKGNTLTRDGAVQISTAQSRFGGSSAYFNGGVLYTGDSSSFGVSNGDFTVEGFVSGNVPSSQFWCLFDNRSAGKEGFSLNLGGNLHTLCYANNSAVIAVSNIEVPRFKMAHVAVSRQNGTVRLFINGKLCGSVSDTRTMASTAAAYIGRAAGGYQGSTGYMDMWRMTKGVARYVADFTPPTFFEHVG